MKQFKFLSQIYIPRVRPGYLKLKDARNKNKHLLLLWSEYPLDNSPEITHLRMYQGNILGFYNQMKSMDAYPTIFKVRIQYRGVSHTPLSFINHQTQNLFISRKFHLTIIYSVL